MFCVRSASDVLVFASALVRSARQSASDSEKDGQRKMRFPHLSPLPCVLASQESCAVGPGKIWVEHAPKDLTGQYIEQLREDVEYRREWCDKIGFNLANHSELSQPKRRAVVSRKAA
jgi:hypothetical protein